MLSLPGSNDHPSLSPGVCDYCWGFLHSAPTFVSYALLHPQTAPTGLCPVSAGTWVDTTTCPEFPRIAVTSPTTGQAVLAPHLEAWVDQGVPTAPCYLQSQPSVRSLSVGIWSAAYWPAFQDSESKWLKSGPHYPRYSSFMTSPTEVIWETMLNVPPQSLGL